MPHQRYRHLIAILEKRLRLFPIVGVLGARQTGKSTLLRDLLPSKRKIHYTTLDRQETREQAKKQPTLFIQNLESSRDQTVCIDEVQKVPELFDTLKAEVDEDKRPGRFVLSGSTEFSKKTGIRDALTGRIALLRLYPFNQAEIENRKPGYPLINPFKSLVPKKQVELKNTSMWLNRGGMPGIFALIDSANRASLFENWIETSCTRDLAFFEIPRFNPELARRILFETAKAKLPNRTEIAKAVGKTPRQIEAYLQAFKALFILYEIDPFHTSVGKSNFYFFDAGVAEFEGATIERLLQTWFLNECFSQFSYSGQMRPDIFVYQTSRGSCIDFVIIAKNIQYGVKLVHEESPSTYSLRSVTSFRDKHPKIPMIIAAPCLYIKQPTRDPNIKILPWSGLT